MQRGVFEIQFNWIFVIIAGGVILFFFLSLISKQKATSDESINQDVLRRLDTILISTEQGYQTYKELHLVKTQLTFTCEDTSPSLTTQGIISNLQIGSFSVDTPTQILFTPPSLNTDTFQLWTDTWDQPFRVLPFLYVTAPEVSFYIVETTPPDRSQEIYELLPANVSKKLITAADINYLPNKNDQYSVVIFLDAAVNLADPLYTPSQLKGDVRAVKVESTGDAGEVTFYKKSFVGNFFENGTLPFIGNEMLLGSIVAADAQAYACNVKKALVRYKTITELHLARVINLSGMTDPTCIGPLTAGRRTLESMNTTLNFTTSAFQMLDLCSTDLQTSNEDLVRGRRCPLIY
ncbi:MAG: hypothetical protein V1725_06225 [archaeon]